MLWAGLVGDKPGSGRETFRFVDGSNLLSECGQMDMHADSVATDQRQWGGQLCALRNRSVVVSLATTNIPAGQMAVLQAMALGKLMALARYMACYTTENYVATTSLRYSA